MKNTHRINGLIYITSGDEIKDCHVVNIHTSEVYFLKGYYGMQPNTKKIILTNDPTLIADGIQAIDPDAVKWLNDNSSCEEVEIDNRPKISSFEKGFVMGNPNYNKIIIPKHQTIENRSNYSISLNEVYETKEIEEEAETYTEQQVFDLILLSSNMQFKSIQIGRASCRERVCLYV